MSSFWFAFYYLSSHVNAHLVCNALIIFNVLAEIHGWIPDAILVVEATTALLRVLLLRDGNLIPGELRSSKLKQNRYMKCPAYSHYGGGSDEQLKPELFDVPTMTWAPHLAQDMDFSSGWLSGRWSPLKLYTCSL